MPARSPLPRFLVLGQVNRPCRITQENNEKIRPQPDRENAFAGENGGGDGPEIQPSPFIHLKLNHNPHAARLIVIAALMAAPRSLSLTPSGRRLFTWPGTASQQLLPR